MAVVNDGAEHADAVAGDFVHLVDDNRERGGEGGSRGGKGGVKGVEGGERGTLEEVLMQSLVITLT